MQAPAPAPGSRTIPGRLLGGAGHLFRGIGFCLRNPGVAAQGLLPALIVGAVALTGLVILAVRMSAIVEWATPFAGTWDPAWSSLLRLGLSMVTFLAALLLTVLTFTTVTLTVGDPFYERIRRAVGRETGDPAPEANLSVGQQVLDFLRIIALGLLVALLTAACGFIPVIGGILGTVLGIVLNGSLLARELTGRLFAAHGLGPVERRAYYRGNRVRMLGFGALTQLSFVIPLGAVFFMPAAVAGGTVLAQRMLREGSAPAARVSHSPDGVTTVETTARPHES